jgi:hypothetical protein
MKGLHPNKLFLWLAVATIILLVRQHINVDDKAINPIIPNHSGAKTKAHGLDWKPSANGYSSEVASCWNSVDDSD